MDLLKKTKHLVSFVFNMHSTADLVRFLLLQCSVKQYINTVKFKRGTLAGHLLTYDYFNLKTCCLGRTSFTFLIWRARCPSTFFVLKRFPYVPQISIFLNVRRQGLNASAFPFSFLLSFNTVIA